MCCHRAERGAQGLLASLKTIQLSNKTLKQSTACYIATIHNPSTGLAFFERRLPEIRQLRKVSPFISKGVLAILKVGDGQQEAHNTAKSRVHHC